MNLRLTLSLVACIVGIVPAARSDNLAIERVPQGSGTPNLNGYENASPVGDEGLWHAPQFLPGFPTAATLWPRVIVVHCLMNRCEGYTLTPDKGRGEYLFFVPEPPDGSSFGTAN